MTLAAGARLGAYEVATLIGVGGMGEVYRATDTNLGRQVAVKVLPDTFAQDPDRAARFEREARTLASLNHPNIAAIYGLERTGGISALVMELVEGATLADRISQGAMPVDEALSIARQIAEGLEAAHEQGVVHRDLKPANIKLRPDGTVKILDFGLAKAFTTENASPSTPVLANSPTLTSPVGMTGVGIILGTAAYMAPEQAKGRPIDKRSDVWAFGCVMYEMLTGTRAFDGEDIADVLANVLKSEPDWTRLPAGAPSAVQRLLRRCLRKDPKLRVPDISVARFEIEDVLAGSADRPELAPMPQQRPVPRGMLAAGAGGILALATGIGGTWFWLRPDQAPLTQLTIQRPDGAPMGGTTTPSIDLDISPDGRRVVYVVRDSQPARNQFFVQQLDQIEPLALGKIGNPYFPAFSPDGHWIAYSDFETRLIIKVPAAGGPPTRIAPYTGAPRGLSWGDDDSIVFATVGSGLMRVPAAGGTPEPITTPKGSVEESEHWFPHYLPGARGVLFTVTPGQPASAEELQTAVLDLRTREYRVIVPGASSARYVRSGHVVYATGETLRAARFDLENLEVRGEGMPVVERVATKASGAASVGVSATGTLAYLRGAAGVVSERTLVWIDRQGREEPIAGAPVRAYVYPRLSRDGTRVALDIRDRGGDTWVLHLNRQSPTLQQITFDPGPNRGVAWNHDATRIAFSIQRDGTEGIYWQSADGTGTPVRLTEGKRPQLPLGFTPDGNYLLFMEPERPPWDIYLVGLADRKIQPLLTEPKFSELNGEVSPNGRWLAYQSNESGSDEVYVRSFPNVDDQKRLVSSGGGTRPTWSANGKELFYFTPPDTIMAVPVTTNGVTFAFDNPAVAVKANLAAGLPNGRTYAVSADGKRFLVIKNAAQGPTISPQLVINLNWVDELKRLVP